MKISKLTFSSWVFLPFFILNLWTSVANAQSACTAASDAATLTTAAGIGNGFFAQCKSTPDAMKLKFYKMALCKDKPTYLDDSSCVYILNETTAIDAEISVGGDVPCVVNKQLNEQTPTTSYDIFLLHDLTTPANVDESNCMPVKPANKVANYIWGVQTFNVPPSITANTTQVDMGFKLTDGINVSLKGTPGSACDRNTGNECVESANIMSFAFTMSTE
jgi:hypothetical protein